jgi:hypothetical protein
MPLNLSANGSGILKWWVDESFAVHPNMRGHSGGGLYLGRAFTIASSTKKKLNTPICTETEIVGADDFMSTICWTRLFMKAQGNDVKDNVRGEKMLLEYVAYSFLDCQCWGRILYGPVIPVLDLFMYPGT